MLQFNVFLFLSLSKDMVLTDCISFIHLNFLSKICAESGFKGLAYCGGPEVKCKELDKPTILPCVEYSSKEKDFGREVDLQPSCRLCLSTEHGNVNKLVQVSVVWSVVSAVIYNISSHRHLLNQPQLCHSRLFNQQVRMWGVSANTIPSQTELCPHLVL